MFKQCYRAVRLSFEFMQRALLLAPMAAVIIVILAAPHARAGGRLTAFDSDPIVGKEELSKLRGGFNLGNGAVINFGLEVQQFVNDTTKPINDVQIALVQNRFTVTQTSGGKTTTTDLTGLPQTFAPPGAINNGATQLAVTVTNQAVQSLIQNSANNQALTSVTTLNVQTQGLVNSLHQAMAGAQLVQTLQMNGWTHH